MKNNYHLIVGIIFLFLYDWTVSRKIKVGPCMLVLEDEGECPDPDYIKVYLFTRKNVEEGQYVAFTEVSDNMTSSHYNAQNSNKIIIHGYYSDMFLDVLVDIKTEYLQQGDTNVWMVDFPKLVSGTLCYTFAVHNIQHVGHCLVQLITALRRHSSADIHVVGFSLGAHVANYIANKLGSPKLDRITGLDPAGPLFMSRSEQHRLDPSDANFVDVVHTNALVQGIVERSGHIDFFMNGGVTQPGCHEESYSFACDHHRAAAYFAESIRTKVGFLGWQCEGYVQYFSGNCKPKTELVYMGEACPPGSEGFYIAYTAAEKPFALGNWTGVNYKQRSLNLSVPNVTDTNNTNQDRRDMLKNHTNIIPTVQLQ